MLIDKPGMYKTRDGRRAEAEYCNGKFAFGSIAHVPKVWLQESGVYRCRSFRESRKLAAQEVRESRLGKEVDIAARQMRDRVSRHFSAYRNSARGDRVSLIWPAAWINPPYLSLALHFSYCIADRDELLFASYQFGNTPFRKEHNV